MTGSAPETVDERLASLPTERLEARICEWATAIAAADAEFLAMVAEFDRRKGWVAWGMPSCAAWLSHACALAPSAARERVRVAQSLRGLPRIRALFRQGRLSYSKVRALTRVATDDTESELIDLASSATAGQLEVIVRAWRKCQRAQDTTRHERQQRDRHFDMSVTDDGSLTGRFSVPAEHAPVVRKAIERFCAPPPRRIDRADASAETPSATQRRADAFVAAADASLSGSPRAPHERTMTVIEVEHDVLAHGGDGTCHTQDNQVALCAETARRLACDSTEMVVVVDADGNERARSRPTRSIPRDVRRALQRRDHNHCRYPGCTNDGAVEAHHLVHRANGGPNELANLVTLCRFHHHLVHEGGFRLATPDGGDSFVATTPEGRTLTDDQYTGPWATPPRSLIELLADIDVEPKADAMLVGTGERMDMDSLLFAVGGAVRRQHERATLGPQRFRGSAAVAGAVSRTGGWPTAAPNEPAAP